MAKKDFGNIGKNTHMGGGMGNLIPDMDKKAEVPEIEEKEAAKTFYMIESDHKFLLAYARHMAFHKNAKYPVKAGLHDAIQLLKEAHPEIGTE